jgi:HSP20 family molecular chaperone IbpA
VIVPKEEAMSESLEVNQGDSTEATHTGLLVSPAVDIFEDQDAITLLADMPGVAVGDLEIDLNEGVLTITGRSKDDFGEKEQEVSLEFGRATFQRKFTLSQSVDQAKIEARLDDGVLRLRLPKAEQAKPRKIEVKN